MSSPAPFGAVPLHPGVPDQTLIDLDFPRVLARLAEHARTVLGQRLARVPRLWEDVGRVRRELGLTTEVRLLVDAGTPPPLGGISDVGAFLDHAAKQGALEASELLQIADSLRGMWLLRRYLDAERENAPGLFIIGTALPDLEHLHTRLYDTFDDDGTISDDASPALEGLRARRRALHEQVHRRIQQLLKDDETKSRLQDQYFTIREDRYVLPVRSGERGAVDGIIHGSSQTGQTLYIEPAELVGVNNELKLCEQAVALEEYKILSRLTDLLREHRAEIRAGLEVVAEIDVILARARLAIEMEAHPPIVSTDGPIRLNRARNPLLVLRRIPVVANDVTVGDGFSLLVLTGPNAGGKTVTLGTTGLCALMTRAGLHLPVGPDSAMPVYTRVLTVVGDNQDLQSDLSTFSGHVKRVQDVLDRVQARSLVLLDELAVGTEPSQGAALGIAMCEAIADRGATGIVTTHYERMKTLSLEDPRFKNGAVGLDDKTHEPTYRLTMGLPGSSSALEIAARQGLDSGVVERAGALLGDRGRSLERALQQLDMERTALDAERLALLAERRDIGNERRILAAEQERLTKDGDRLVREARADALQEITQIRQQLGAIVKDLQKSPDARSVQKRRVQVSELEKALVKGKTDNKPAAQEEVEEEQRPLERSEAAVGIPVWVPAFSKEGRIEEVRGGKVVVSVGSIRTTVPIASLKHPKVGPKRPSTRARAPVTVRPLAPPPRSPDNTCDVRGHRMDEALEKVDRFLDQALLKSWAVVFVLHGHGTGRLKAGLRDALRTSHYVDRWEKAIPDHGGDAVTVVWLQ